MACHSVRRLTVKKFNFVEPDGLQVVGAVFDIASGEVIFLD